MADTKIPIFNADAQTAYIDYRTEATNLEGRQVIVVGDPSVNANVAAVKSEDVGLTSTEYGMVVRLAGSAQVNAVAGTIGVNLGKVDGTIQVNVGKVDDLVAIKATSVSGSFAVHLLSTGGTIGVRVGQVDGSVAIHLVGTSGTLRVGDIPGSVAVYFSPAQPTLKGIADSIGVNLGKVDGTIQVNVGKISDTIAVFLIGTAGTLGVRVGQIDGSVAIHLVGTGGSLAVKIDPGYNVVNAAHTIVIPSVISGSTSGVSASGVQIVAPEAGHNTKVFAISLTTTAQVQNTFKFTNGAGTGPTEFWRVALQAPTQGIAGANLAVTPPGYLFATGVNVTLSLVGDGSLVHYSVGYFKESA